MAGLDDQPIDPAAADQLAMALDPSAPGDPSYWAPDHWFAQDQGAPPLAQAPVVGGQPADVGPAAPIDAAPPVPYADMGAPAQPPPIDSSLAGVPPAFPIPGGPPPQPAPGTVSTQPVGPGTVASSGLVSVHSEQPGEFAVDALTGAAPRPGEASPTIGDARQALTPEQGYQAVASQYRQRPDLLISRMIGGGPVDPDTQRYLNEMATRNPGGFAELNQHVADARTKFVAAEHARIADEDFRRQQDNVRIRQQAVQVAQQKSAALDARAQELANTKIGDLSIGQRILGVVAGFIGGLYQGKTGSARNPGLDAFNEAIAHQVDAEKMQLANKRDVLGQQRNAVGEELARSGDLYQASETVRLAALKHADDILATQQQNFAADGTRGMQIAALRAGIQTQQIKTLQDNQQKDFDNSVKLQTTAREQQLADSAVAKNRADIAKTYAETAKLRGELGNDPLLTPQQIHQQFPALPVAAIPPNGAKLKDLEKHIETYNKSTEAANKESSTIIRDPVTFEPLPAKGGGFARAGDATIADKANERIGQSQRFVDTLSEIKRTLATDPSSFDRSKFAALGTQFNTAKKDFIKSTGANFTSREMDAVEEMFGPDIDNYTSRLAGRSKAIARFDSLIKMAQGDTDTEVGAKFGVERKRNPDGSYQSLIRDTSAPPPTTTTPEDAQVKSTLGKARDVSAPVTVGGPLPSQVMNEELDRVAMARHGRPFNALTAEDLQRGEESKIRQEAQRNMGLALQRGQVDHWASQLSSPDAAVASQAAQHLGDVAGAGTAPGAAESSIRDYARQILQNNIAAGIPTEGPP